MDSVNYDWRNRKRRQDIPKQYIENGSFYLFKPEVLKQNNNRFGEKIGVVEMEFWKMFEIDSMDDLRMCSALMKEFIIK
jgi:N-acylneuraminate cytidylyltransferase